MKRLYNYITKWENQRNRNVYLQMVYNIITLNIKL